MKIQITVRCPYGLLKSKVSSPSSEDEFKQLQNLIENFTTYFSFEDEDGNMVILKEEVAKNSVFCLVKVD
jgi:hypothetical protein